jgi:DNA polymerase type B, organellar and viral
VPLTMTITETHETEKHKKTNHVSRERKALETNPTRSHNPAMNTKYNDVDTEFIAIDGEGITLSDGTHRYVLLGIGDQQITNPNGLPWHEVFEFLWSQFLINGTTSTAYVGFFLGYDFVQWFKSFTEERARMLLTVEGRAKRAPRKSSKRVQPFPVQYGEWEFDILGNKRFKLRKRGAKRWMNICDSGPFFQKSFLKVIDPAEWSTPIVTQEEYDEIARGKGKRSTASLDAEMMYYNKLENSILPRVLTQLNDGFKSLGIHLRPNQWYGPGQAASAWLTTRAITAERLAEVTPQSMLEYARMSYFGGWFEIMAHGIIPDSAYEYDINSAYPYIISQLPCLEHGQWVHNGAITDYTLVYARVHGSDPYIGTMLHRDPKGNIYRPHHTEGWYWLHEINAAQRAKIIDTIEILESWSYSNCKAGCSPPLREVADIYDLRKQVGKKTPLGIACKLVPNSLYGKFAQSIGSPEFANPIYASLITAGCRTMILNAIATHPEGTKAVVMVATDGVYFRTPHPTLPISGNLGDWDYEAKIRLCLFKPGVYWDNKTREQIEAGIAPVFKSRGVSASDFGATLMLIDETFIDYGKYDIIPSDSKTIESYGTIRQARQAGHHEWPRVKFPVSFSMITAIQALQRNDWSLAGSLISDPKLQQSSDPKSKRVNPYRDGDILRSSPRINEPYEASHPYEKRFGMEDPFSQENLERTGITPDGLTVDITREALGMN